jgi:RNA polymerase sigma factor (sigma-70 family)
MSVETEAPRTGTQVAESLATDLGQRKALRLYAQMKFGIKDQDSEDLIQETMIQLMQTKDLVLRPGGFVLRVFHTRCCDHLRRQRLRGKTDAALAFMSEIRPHAAHDGAPLALSLRQGFERISLSCRQLLSAYYVEGRSLKETAEAMALSHRGIWTRINRCLGRLKKCLKS